MFAKSEDKEHWKNKWKVGVGFTYNYFDDLVLYDEKEEEFMNMILNGDKMSYTYVQKLELLSPLSPWFY